MKISFALTLLAGIALGMIAPAEAADPMAKPHKPMTAKGVTAARGQQVFVELCALCHGMKGKGDGPRSAFFPEGQFIPDLSDASIVNGRDAEILQNISEGLRRLDEPLLAMPQFKYILSDEDMKSALAYIKTLPGQSKSKATKK